MADLNIDEMISRPIRDLILLLTSWNISQFDAKAEADRAAIQAAIAYKLTKTLSENMTSNTQAINELNRSTTRLATVGLWLTGASVALTLASIFVAIYLKN